MQPIDFLVTSLQAVLPFVPKTRTRPALAAVHLIPHPQGGVVLITTDNETLACSYDADAPTPAKPLDLIFPGALTTLLTTRSNRDVKRLHVAEDLTTCLTQTTYTLAPAAYPFPDYQHALAQIDRNLRHTATPGAPPPTDTWGLAADKLARIAAAAHHAYQRRNSDGRIPLQINGAAPQTGLIITTPVAPETFWVIAGLVTSARPATLPDWLPPAPDEP